MKLSDYISGKKKIAYARMVKLVAEIIVVAAGAVVVYLLAGNYDLLENTVEFASKHEKYELDEVIIVGVYLLISICILSTRWLWLLFKSERIAKNLYNELIIEQTKVKYLHGVIPICASCKKIRNDKGAWQELEEYIDKNSEATFTHGICKECIAKLYPEIAREED